MARWWTMGSRLARWRGLLGVAVHRALAPGGARQLWLTVAGVAVPVALLLVVTGMGFGLATESTVRSPGVDYWVVPEGASAGSSVVSVGGPQLGEVHATSARVNEWPEVEYSTPVLLEVVRVSSGEASEFVLAVGVVPRAAAESFVGVSTAGLTPGDPYFAAGDWTGEAVLSTGAAAQLGAAEGSTLRVETTGAAPDRDLAVTRIERTSGSGLADFPVVLVHLGELQALTGAEAGDRADQLLVKTAEPGVRPALAALYPNTLVLSRTGLAVRQTVRSELPLAMAGLAFVVALVVGGLFVASTMGLAVAAESRTRALLAALGFSGRSRAALVAIEALVVAVLGGVVGVGLGAAGILAVNAGARRVVDLPVARFEPVLVGYGVGVAALIGLAVAPYLLVVSRRTTDMEALQR